MRFLLCYLVLLHSVSTLSLVDKLTVVEGSGQAGGTCEHQGHYTCAQFPCARPTGNQPHPHSRTGIVGAVRPRGQKPALEGGTERWGGHVPTVEEPGSDAVAP